MQSLLSASAAIDRFLTSIARLGGWMGLILVLVVFYDVITRYFGVPKPFGLNSTQIQESEYWLHTYLFALVIGYAYTRQSHVRIDLVRDRLPRKIKYLIETLGTVIFLITYCAVGIYFTTIYAHNSFLEGEVSKSTIGLSHIWVLKSAMPIMFILLALAGLSQLIKSVAGLTGNLPEDKVAETIGGDM